MTKLACEYCEREVEKLLDNGLCENCNETLYDLQQERLMEDGGGPTLQEQQQAAWKIKHGLR